MRFFWRLAICTARAALAFFNPSSRAGVTLLPPFLPSAAMYLEIVGVKIWSFTLGGINAERYLVKPCPLIGHVALQFAHPGTAIGVVDLGGCNCFKSTLCTLSNLLRLLCTKAVCASPSKSRWRIRTKEPGANPHPNKGGQATGHHRMSDVSFRFFIIHLI